MNREEILLILMEASMQELKIQIEDHKLILETQDQRYGFDEGKVAGLSLAVSSIKNYLTVYERNKEFHVKKRKPFYIFSQQDFDYLTDTLSEILNEEHDIEKCKAYARFLSRKLEEVDDGDDWGII